MSTRSYIFKERDDGSYVGVCCHCGGYLTHNDAMLLDHYNSEKSVDWQGINDMYDDDSWRMTNYLSKEDDLGIGSEEIKAQADKVGIASKTRVSLNLIQNLAANGQKVLV